MKRLGLCVLAMSASLAGCAGNDFDALPGDVCAKQHTTTSDGNEVVVCDALYEQAPFVHLPKVDSGRAFAGIVGTQFVTADGVSYGGVDTTAEYTRHAVALYELALDGHEVKDYQPVLEFSEAIFLAPFMGRSFEGVISRGMGDGKWAETPSLPVRIDVQASPIDGTADRADYEAGATIANLGDGVTAGDGSCMPSLASYGSEAPFAAGADVKLGLYRVPSMHNFGDDHFVMVWTVNGTFDGTLMGPTWYRGPIDVLRGTLTPDAQYEGMGHGTPGSIAELNLEVGTVTGGEACAP